MFRSNTARRPALRWAVLATATVLLAACGGGGTDGDSSKQGAGSSASGNSDKPTSILWVQPMRNHPVHRVMQAGFLAKCKELNYMCDVVGNPSATTYDIPASIPLAQAAISTTKYGAVAVYGPDPAINSYMTQLAGKGYPIVTWHVLPDEGAIKGLKAAVGEDIPAAGANAAVALGEKMGGKGSAAVTEGSYNDTENTMLKAFTRTMSEKYPAIKVVGPSLEGFEPSQAASKAVSVLQANPDVTAAFSTTGNGAQSWSQAAKQTNRKLDIIGMDYIRQNLDLVKSGDVFGLVAQPLFEEGGKVAEVAAAMIKGEPAEYRNPLPAPVITKADLDKYYRILDHAGV